jgi:hypothetical protein
VRGRLKSRDLELLRTAVLLHSVKSVALILACAASLIIVRKVSLTIETIRDIIQHLAEGKV